MPAGGLGFLATSYLQWNMERLTGGRKMKKGGQEQKFEVVVEAEAGLGNASSLVVVTEENKML